MRRRSATGLGVIVALSSVAAALLVSSELSDARKGERQAYAAALAAREAAALAAAPVDVGGPEARDRSKTLCLRGAETVAARVARFLDSRVVDAAGRLDVAALAKLSRRAADVDRSAALPQRMGRHRAEAEGAQPASWEPIDPPDRICVELEAARAAHGSRRAAGAK